MTWVVCGPPRSATTFMLEALAAYTPLTVVWDLNVEWRSRTETGLVERFRETAPGTAHGPDVLVKVLNPGVSVPDVERAVLMVRDPAEITASARKIRQSITAADIAGRMAGFRGRYRHLDEVHVAELADLPRLMRRLGEAGWPVVGPCWRMATRAMR